MELKTKFNYGDTVYLMNDNKIVYGTVRKICTETARHQIKCDGMYATYDVTTNILYDVYGPRFESQKEFMATKRESEIHKTKEELLLSLL